MGTKKVDQWATPQGVLFLRNLGTMAEAMGRHDLAEGFRLRAEAIAADLQQQGGRHGQEA